MGGIVHIVLFEFKPSTSEASVQDVCRRMLALREQCLHPATQRPYIKTSSGGRDNSTEGNQKGITHGFVVEFDNEDDRKHYLEKDPAHLSFVKSLDGLMANVQVIDYTPGVF